MQVSTVRSESLLRALRGEGRHDMTKPPDLDRRGFIGLAAATAATLSTRVNAMNKL